MKPRSLPPSSRKTRNALRRAAILALLASGPCLPEMARAEDPPQAEPKEAETEEAAATTEETGPLLNWLDLTLGGAIVDGNDAAFQHRTGHPSGLFGGSSSFHYQQDVAEGTTFKVDGRGLFGAYDYLLELDLSKEDVGYLRAGLSEFRSYSDGSGGYLSADQSWLGGLYDDDLHLDRREFWIEGGLRLPKYPSLTLRYTRQEREGQTDSTSWGPYLSGTPGIGTRGLTPAFWDLNQNRDILALDARKTIGTTGVDVGLRYEKQDDDDSRNLRRYPGQGPALDRHVTDRHTTESDLFNIHASTETKLKDNLWLTLGYAYTDLDTDTSGYRAYGTGYDPDLNGRIADPNTFQDLSGGSRLSQHIANLNLMWNLKGGFTLTPSLRFEKQDVSSTSGYQSPAQTIAPLASSAYGISSDRGLLDVSEAIELRYTGITNVVLYARGDWLQGTGDLDESWDNFSTSANVLNRTSDDTRNAQKYSVGANWYPFRRFSLGAGYYHKIRHNDFDALRDSTANTPPAFSRYPAYLVAQDYTVDDLNFRATWRPRGNVTLVARYDYQLGTIENQADQLEELESAEMTSHILSGSLSWVPWKRLYLQGRLSYVQDQTESPVAGITPAVQDAENDYWTATASAGFALSNDVDLEVSYFYYLADNYVDNSVAGMPYGAGTEENGISASLNWRITRKIRWTNRYSFLTSADDTSGGNNDFDAHLLYSSIQYRF